jgi:hypothetical protein
MTGSTGRPARGRRDNGLDAREFVPVGDLDPRVGEHLLDVLAVARIAAYLQPTADFNPIIRTTTLPAVPTDRLWVDREHSDHARALVAKVQAEGAPPAAEPPAHPEQPTDLDIDAAWRDIVASYDDPAGDAAARWPAVEDTSNDPPSAPGTALIKADHLRPIGLGPRDHSLAEPQDGDLDSDADSDLDDSDEGYEPPPPPPIPKPSGQAVLGVLGVVIGMALFFFPSLLPIDTQGAMVLGVVGVLGGAGLLVYLLKDGLTGDDDPDDGAVV